ncbi:amidohydrolase [Brevibacterium litoralis]|uniref:amidohydrolase n=1 Tax=Brevibacterium litoralis TaxID=3138935 RepID=UPI0032EE8613
MYTSVPVPPVTTVVLTGGTVLPIAARGERAAPIENGTVVLENGRLTAVGPAASVTVPEGATTVDVSGKVVTPGLVEAHGHVGIHEDGEGWSGNDTNEMTAPNQAGVRAIDGIDPCEIGMKDALRGGVTAAVVKPGSGNAIGGRTAAIKLWGRIVDEMLISQDVSVKSALGENPKRVYGERTQLPSTRMGTAKVIRDAFVAASNYAAKRAAAEEKGEPFDRDLELETLAEVLDGTLAWDQHCHRADDIATAIRLSEEFGYRLVVNHGTEGHLIADYIAAKGVDAIVGPLMTTRSKVELRNRTLATPAVLAEAGVRIALTTDAPVIPIDFLIHEAALCVKAGLDPVVALETVTVNPARILGLDERIGSLEVGKDADVVVWDRHPLDLDARAEHVYVGGREVYTHDAATGKGLWADPFGETYVATPA